jgi:RHS repeat-associated protein
MANDCVGSNCVNGNWTYQYDDFNRLKQATNASTNPNQIYQYLYDRFGNRWQQNQSQGTNYQTQLTFNGDNQINGISGVNGNPFQYDAAGNLMMDGHNCYSYDAENRLVSVVPETAYWSGVCGPTTAATARTYLYDPDGRRAAKLQNGSISEQYYYDAGGHMITDADANGNTLRAEIYAGSRHLATWNNSATYFNHADWLGTERVRSNSSGSACETITSLPFGDGEVTSGSCTPTPTFFTGKERDAESGLDYFGARYNASSLGRFMSPDPFIPFNLRKDKFQVWISNPQRWNKYAYGLNNPTTVIDPNGMDACGSNDQSCKTKQKVFTWENTLTKQVWVQATTTTVRKDEMGNTITTVTTTNAFYSTAKGREGEFLSGNQKTETTLTTPEGTVQQSLPSTGGISVGINQKQAVLSLGNDVVKSAIAKAVPGWGSEFGRVTAEDMRANPGKYVRAGVEAGVALTPGGVIEEPKAIIDVGVAAIELTKALTDPAPP